MFLSDTIKKKDEIFQITGNHQSKFMKKLQIEIKFQHKIIHGSMMNFINLICIYFTLFLPLSSAIPILNFGIGNLVDNENEIQLRSKFDPILESKAINSSSIITNTIPHSTSISVEIPSNDNYSKEVELFELDMFISCKKRGITEKVEKAIGKHWFDALVGVRLMTNLGRTNKRNSTLQYAGKGGKNSGKGGGGGGGNEESSSSSDHRTSRGSSKGMSS